MAVQGGTIARVAREEPPLAARAEQAIAEPAPSPRTAPRRRDRFLSDITAEHAYALNYARVDRLTKRVLWAHFVALVGLALLNGFYGLGQSTPSPLAWRPITPWQATGLIAIGYAAAFVPILLRGKVRSHYAWRALATTGLTTFSFLFIAVSGGSIEMHFHIFIVMAYVCVYADWRLVWLTSLLVLAHHLLLNPLAPAWLFEYGRVDLGLFTHAVATLTAAAFMTVVCENQRNEVVSVRLTQRDLEHDIVRRRQAEAALRESNAMRGAVLESAMDCIITIDHQGRITEFNPAAERTFGYKRDEVLGADMADVIIPPGLREAHREGLRRYARTGQSNVAGRRLQMVAVRRDGSQFPVELTITPIQGASPIAFTGYMRDLTTQKRAEEETEAARRLAAQHEKMIALGSLVSGVAHEIRTPLTYLQNSLHVVRHRLARSAEQGRSLEETRREVDGALESALEGAERVNRLVGELRHFTRVRPGARVATALNPVVGEAVGLFRATYRGRVSVDADLRATQPILIDRLQVQQIVLNLLANAAEAMPRGGVVHVRTRPAPDNLGALLIVEDEGEGMTPEVRARIFEPLFTTKPHGTGLGLSIVKRIVEGHHAIVTCESTLGKGTVFTIAFPRPTGEPEAPASVPVEL